MTHPADRPRFIAGAVCPQCRETDRIVVEALADGQRRRCVSCGHSDTLTSNAPAEPLTRLSRRRAPQTPATAVRIITGAADRHDSEA